MQDVSGIIDDVREQVPGAISVAIGEARLLIQSWMLLLSRPERSDQIEYLLDASTLLAEVARDRAARGQDT